MRRLAVWLSIALILYFSFLSVALESAFAEQASITRADNSSGSDSRDEAKSSFTQPVTTPIPIPAQSSSRSLVLVASLTVFVLSVFVGFEIIAKVPPTLHTPLMSGSNAISGITVIGAIIAAGYKETGVGSLLGLVAIVLAMINVVGGFLVTHRMLLMFKKR
ncbi:MAG TPA: NAD(P) transhydrogenase subunit alpha [Pirellula sp.]|nr:NAD(P) transhydrogenase subunit alpha [Pirellula sp.]